MSGHPRPPGLAPHAGSTPTVLAVDDIPANLELLTSILEEEGYRVLAARNGTEALSVALQAEPDLVLLDVNLPDLDGYEVCRRLKQEPRLSEVPVLTAAGRCSLSGPFFSCSTSAQNGLPLGSVFPARMSVTR